MPKRTTCVILSSDEEENAKPNDSASLLILRGKVSPKTQDFKSVPRTRKPPKKARCSASRSAPPRHPRALNEFEPLYDDFKEGFAELMVSPGLRIIGAKESWVEKYKPHTIEELAIHKKKVEEVRAWLVDRLKNSKTQLHSNVLLITGSAGVGKSVTIQVLASQFGAELFEWNTPTPTIWQEHVHHSISGIRYLSKLDEFENFVERVRKFGLLPSSTSLSSRASVMLLIDDLPVVYGKIAYHRLLKCLQLLAKSVQIPTVIVVTDYGGAESGDNKICSAEQLWLSIKIAGASKIAFNPITVSSIKKVLSRISRQEQCNTSLAEIDLIANASEGDIRNAIHSLQYICLNPRPRKNKFSSVHTPISSEGNTGFVEESHSHPFPFGRDQTISLFHALGKFLHNKRDTENTVLLGQHEFPMREEFSRLPLKMDAPEKILCQAYGQARPVAEFLHENATDFIAEDAVKDAWVVASYLSDADCLLSSLHQMFGGTYRAENIAQLVAASVAARGVLFGNSHPSPLRWHSIRKPELWHVEQTTRRCKYEMERQRSEAHRLGASGISVFSTEYRPMLRWLDSQSIPVSSHPCHDSSKEFNSANSDQIQTDDEIEDF